MSATARRAIESSPQLLWRSMGAPGLERHSSPRRARSRAPPWRRPRRSAGPRGSEPPPAEHGVAAEAEEDGAGEVRAEHVLGARAVGGVGAERVGESLLGKADECIAMRLVAVKAMGARLVSTRLTGTP